MMEQRLISCIALLLAISHALEDSPFRECRYIYWLSPRGLFFALSNEQLTIQPPLFTIKADQGQIVFVSSSGELESHPSLSFDQDDKTVKMSKFIADSFYGDSIDFRGREIRNAHLTDSSIESLKHLTVESLALRPQGAVRNQGHGLVLIDGDGMLGTSHHARWDESEKELRIPSISSFSKAGLEIRSDVDFTSHQLKNFNILANTTLRSLIIQDGMIENTILHNVTATEMTFRDITLDSLKIERFDSAANIGSLMVIGEGGAIESSSSLKLLEGELLINSEVVLTKSMDLNGHDILNANLRSGSIDGNIDISVNRITGKGITLTEIQDDKTVTSDGLAMLGLDGKLKLGPISVDESGSLGDVRVHGTIDFIQSKSSFASRGKLKGANIVGGTVDELEKLRVMGDAELGSGLEVTGETYLDGSLTVSGSVLGSGPYVDVSDKRLKKNVERMNSPDVLEKIRLLHGVSYQLDMSSVEASSRLGRRNSGTNSEETPDRQLGFIAQEVEEIFPEVVYTDGDDFKGLQYSRFAPILVEALKQLTDELRALQTSHLQLAEEKNDLEEKLHLLEQSVFM